MKTLLSILMTLLLHHNGFSQIQFHPEESRMSVKGTSTLHDWESVVKMEEVKIELHIEDADPLLLGHLRLKIPVKSIKSGNNIMDKKTYKALKADQYPTINYEVAVFDHKEGQVAATDGRLKVAGVEKIIPVAANYSRKNNGILTFTGTVSFNMTDFKVDPPTAMMGTLKTGDEISIPYTIVLQLINK